MLRPLANRSSSVRRRGAVTVEMALVLPIFCSLVFGIIEFGRGFMVAQLVTNAAREGARRAIVDGSTNSDVTSFIQTFLNSSANVGTGDVKVTITVTPATGNPSNPGNNIAACQSRDLIAITVSVPFDKVALITGKYLAGKNLTGKASMRHE
jgi:Flp pilus assembly protein TadG